MADRSRSPGPRQAAKRRLRNKTQLTSEEFDDVVRLTALADGLQHRLDGAVKDLEELRWRAQELGRRLAQGVAACSAERAVVNERRSDGGSEVEPTTAP